MAAFAGLLVPCSGKNLQQRNEAISRSYCDASIVAGVEGNKANGLDPDVQARNRSVRMGEIPRHHPGWTVWWVNGEKSWWLLAGLRKISQWTDQIFDMSYFLLSETLHQITTFIAITIWIAFSSQLNPHPTTIAPTTETKTMCLEIRHWHPGCGHAAAPAVTNPTQQKYHDRPEVLMEYCGYSTTTDDLNIAGIEGPSRQLVCASWCKGMRLRPMCRACHG
jgi:hypothetical protein